MVIYVKKIFKIMFIAILFMNIIGKVYADDIEENFDKKDIEEIIETSSKYEENISVNSRIAVAFDRASGRVIWGKNEKKKTAMASTTKIMTAIVVIENANLNDVVEVSSKSASTGGSRLGLKKGDKISVRDLLYGLMLKSGNDTAVALAEHVGGDVENFAVLMNNKACSLNLENTHFVTPHGLDDPEHYTTAYELAKIADYALKNDIFKKIVGTKNYTVLINGYPKDICNTNELLGNYSGVYGVKTGFTNNAGRCLVTAVKKENVDIITVVLQADTKKDRANDSVKIINYICNNYQSVNLENIVNDEFYNWCNINNKRFNVYRAKQYNINFDKDELKYKFLLINRNEIKNIKIQINAIFEYEAPVSQNTKLGEVKVFLGDELLEVNNIYIKNEILRKDFFDYFLECMKSISNII